MEDISHLQTFQRLKMVQSISKISVTNITTFDLGDGFTPLEEISGHFWPLISGENGKYQKRLNPPEAPGSI